MNIQIFGTKKSADTRKAERFFKERGIRFSIVDLKEKGFSKGELQSVAGAVGGLEHLLDQECRDKGLLKLIEYTAAEDKLEKVLENQTVLRQPIVPERKAGHSGVFPGDMEGMGVRLFSRERIRQRNGRQPEAAESRRRGPGEYPSMRYI